jgi:hypothetical protein
MLMASMRDWSRHFRQCYTYLLPGRFIEVFEDVSWAIRWFQLSQEYLASVGIQWDGALGFPEQLMAVGFRLVRDMPVIMELYPDIGDPVEERERVAALHMRDMCDMTSNMGVIILVREYFCYFCALHSFVLETSVIKVRPVANLARGLNPSAGMFSLLRSLSQARNERSREMGTQKLILARISIEFYCLLLEMPYQSWV